MAVLRTVLGDVPAEKMGITYPHEHVCIGYAGARQEMGDRFDREATITEACNDIGKAMKAHGMATIVDVTTPEIGRDTDILYGVSEHLNVNVVACTGYFAQVNGLPFYWRFMDVQKYREKLIRDITEGVAPNGVKCGVIKVAIGEKVLQEREEKAFRAAAQVSQEYGLAICVHTRDGWLDEYPAPLQALDIMLKEGAPPAKIYMGHLEHIFDDPGEHNYPLLLQIAQRGANLAFDVVGRYKDKWDEPRATSVAKLFAQGYGNRVILSMDHQGSWVPERPPRYVSFGTSYLDLYNYLPQLGEAGLTDEQIRTILVDNPRNLLTF
jgi:phosphotriesterase-related protein